MRQTGLHLTISIRFDNFDSLDTNLTYVHPNLSAPEWVNSGPLVIPHLTMNQMMIMNSNSSKNI